MSGPFAVTEACTACGACLRTCPERCLRPVPGGRPPLAVLADRCTGCGECAEVCPAEAIRPLAEVIR
jgi:Pyruvate/2-oxoacid:ferredoxin oxidoreductase delta subunit